MKPFTQKMVPTFFEKWWCSMILETMLFVVIVDYLVTLWWVPPQQSLSSFRTIYVRIYTCLALKTSSYEESQYHWSCDFLLQLRHFLCRADKMFWTTVPLHPSLLKITICKTSEVQTLLVSYDTIFLYYMESTFFYKSYGFIWYWRKLCFLLSAKFYLHPWQTSSNWTLSALDVLSNHSHGCFSGENVFMRVLPLEKRKYML